MRFIGVFVFLLAFCGFSFAEEDKKEETKLEEIVVAGERIIAPTKETSETVYTGTEVTKEGIKLGGVSASSNVWSAISILPGVMFESPDPGNMASTQMSVRVRGISGSLGSMSIEGIPIYGGNPIGPRTYILDLENFESIALYKGAVPAELGPGAGTRGGTLQLRPLWAKDEFDVVFKQFLGSYDYTKSFIRLDSGKVGDLGTKFSLSYSYGEEDKWRGEGKIGPRHNVNFTFVQPLGDIFEIKLWTNYNELDQYKYRALTYAQASNLEAYKRYDYNTTFTGDPSVDWNYYRFWETGWTNYDIFGFITAKLSENYTFMLKPYYRKEEKEDESGSSRIVGARGQAKPGVQFSQWTVERYGAIAEGMAEFDIIKGLLGFQYEWQDWKDEPTENYWLNPDGSLSFVGWGRYTRSTNKGYRYSPYAKVAGTIGGFNWQVGIKYLKLKESDNEGYITKFDQNNKPYVEREPRLDYGGQSYDAWLPTAGVSYTFNENVEIYSSFGRTFQQPYAYMPIVNLYYNLYNKFQKMGITMKDLFNDYKPEKTDNIDIGLRIRSDFLELYPTVFLSRHRNLWTPITPGWRDPDNPNQFLIDPSTNRPVSYSTFVGKAKGYGAELGINLFVSDYLRFFFNPTYSKLEYDGDIVQRGTVFKTDGKQVVDVPEWMFTSGLILSYKGFEVAPVLRYIGKRYGDLGHQEKMPSYWVVDLKTAYNVKEAGFFKDVRLALEFYNLFDKDYIVSPDYYPGAPFTVYGSVSFSF